MTTRVRKFTREELINMKPADVEQAVRANATAVTTSMDMEPRNMKEVIRKTDPYTGLGYQQASNVRVLEEAGVTPVWNMQTGHPTMVLINLLQTKLSETNEQGQLVFTTHPELVPEGLPHIPEYPCMLNEKNEIWSPLATRLGFRPCPKMLRTRHDVITHTRNRHKNAWDSFERDTEENLRSEEHELRVASLAAYKQAGVGVLGMPDGQLSIEKVCVGCGISVFASNDEAALVKLGVHARDCGPLNKVLSNVPTPAQTDELLSDPAGTTTTTGDGTTITMGAPFTIQRPTTDTTVLDKDAQVTETPVMVDKPLQGTKPMVQKSCPHCEFVSESTKAMGAASRLRGHIRKEHPDAN